MAECSKAVARRLHDSRFATRWFVGDGIDVGAGVSGATAAARAGIALLATGLASGAPAQGLPKDTVVRVKNPSPGPGWLEGEVAVAPSGCTMVALKDRAPGGCASLALSVVKAMQRRDGANWADVDVKPWLAKEPKDCRESDND